MATLTVGASQQFINLSAAVAAAQAGDTIDVQAGTYTNDFPGYVNGLTIEGIGGQVNLVATQSPPNGKAILDVAGNTTLKNLDFSGVTVPDGNGAGIRYEGGNLTIQNSSFHGNQDGLLGAPDLNGTIKIDHSEFYNNGTSAGNTHNMYIGDIQQFTLTNSYVHDANVGHEVKSRAENNTINNNRIFENNSTSSYSIDLPNGGNATISGNTIEQGPNGQSGIMIPYGEEGGSSTVSGTIHAGTNVSFTSNTVVNDLTAHTPYLFWDASGAPIASGDTVYGLQPSQLDYSNHVSSSGFAFTSTRPTLDTTTSPLLVAKLANDTGVSSTDGITSNDSLTGTADVNTVVTIQNGSTVLGTTTASAAGQWSFAPAGLADGTYMLTASETDAAGNIDSAKVGFTLDTTAPRPVITQIVRNTGGTVTLSGTSEARSNVTLSDTTSSGTTVVGTVIASSTGAWSETSIAPINTTTINSYTASATDLAGNTGATVGKFLVSSSGRDSLTGITGQSDVFAFLPSGRT